MIDQRFFFILRQAIAVGLGLAAGLGTFSGCGGGGGKSSGGGVTPTGNHYPTASIVSPAGTWFKEGENIVFSVDASDAEDGQLTGGSLVWSSKTDGTLGTGATLITSTLSAGDQEITLTATDSEGDATTVTFPTITVAHTLFIKMGSQTTGVPDASNAFDGDEDIAANIMTPESEFIHFKAFVGGADTFICRIKVGPSTPGSELAVEGMALDSSWEQVDSVVLDNSDQTASVKVGNPQDYKDAEGYINLRVRWVGGNASGSVPVYEIWRSNAVYAGHKSSGVTAADLAFDGDPATSAKITSPWVSAPGAFLHFKAYIGSGIASSFAFSILLDNLGNSQLMSFDAENVATAAWDFVGSLFFDSATARSVKVQNLSKYVDTEGYISLRARWIKLNSDPSLTSVNVRDIQRIDPFFVDSRTANSIGTPANAVDNDPGTYARIGYYWGEFDNNIYHYDYLALQSYAGDSAAVGFSVVTGVSQSGSFVVVEGESEPDKWTEIKRIASDADATTDIDLPNAREFINADGYLSLRFRWQGDSPFKDAYIYEVERK